MTKPSACRWCQTDCSDVNDAAVRGEHLDWLWRQLADVADRRGDPDLVTGAAKVIAPVSPIERAAASGLLNGRAPRGGQSVRVDLAALTARLRIHDARLTPGMLAAHVTGRSLAERVRGNARRRDELEQLRDRLFRIFDTADRVAPFPIDMASAWPALKRAGWTARILGHEDPSMLVDQAAAIIATLPTDGERLDRRRLADTVTRFPHALDTGALPGLVLALLTTAGHIPSGLTPRAAWAAVGVDCDDLTGGLLALGIQPRDWTLPTGAVVTLPPRELARCAWPAPPWPGATVFVTENPSVVTAAADRVAADQQTRHVHLLCTVGTPSAGEISAISRLADTGWQVKVRADFDQAGLQHVRSLLAGVPSAQPWRMGAADYLSSLADMVADNRIRLETKTLPATPWDPNLRPLMVEHGLAAYEEGLISDLLTDLTDESRSAPST